MRRIRAVLIDIDGVLTISWKPLPGTVAGLHRLRAAAVPLALVTNTPSRTRASISGGTVMVGDDIETDVLAAQRQGLTGVLVKTGKYLPRTHQAAAGTPDPVLDSFADLPALLEQLS